MSGVLHVLMYVGELICMYVLLHVLMVGELIELGVMKSQELRGGKRAVKSSSCL